MENKNICPLVQDLLPSLADGITRPGSERMMREHMKTCLECRKMYEDMCPSEDTVLPAEKEDIPVEKFVRKLKIRKILLWCIVSTVIMAMAGVTVYAVSVSRFYKMDHLEEVTIWDQGYMISNASQPVHIAVDGALYHNRQRDYSDDDPEGHTTFVWDTFRIFTADNTSLFEEFPYAETFNDWLPVEDDGTIRSLLGGYNARNMVNEFTFYGTIYSFDRMKDFLLYKFNEDGSFYIVCYPCSSETEALQKIEQYTETFGLQDSYLWEYVSAHYGETLD
ncbi:MAG: hypothetical protein IKV57_07405 [Clostridia bacterium]|nr:hypothetical protein [Clostridia bacterium]